MSAVRVLGTPLKPEESQPVSAAEEVKAMAGSPNYNKVPTFVWAILVTVIIAAGGIVSVQARWQGSMEEKLENQRDLINKLEQRIQIQETYIQNLREKLAERGWNPPSTGKGR